MKEYRGNSLFLWGLLLLLGGCLGENLDDCHPETPYSIHFIYNGDGATDRFSSHIENVQWYVFGRDGQYTDRSALSKSELNEFQGIYPDLAPGEYEVVCWSNTTGLSDITEGLQTINNRFLYSSYYTSGSPVPNFDSLYYARKWITIPDTGGSDTIYFNSAHINMEIFVEGLSTAGTLSRAENDPHGWLVVRNTYAGYDFRMQLTAELISVYPGWINDSNTDELVSRFNLLRFANDNPILIDVYTGNGNKVYTLDLAGFMARNNIEVEGVNEALVSITIRFKETHVHVSVTGWDFGIVEPIL